LRNSRLLLVHHELLYRIGVNGLITIHSPNCFFKMGGLLSANISFFHKEKCGFCKLFIKLLYLTIGSDFVETNFHALHSEKDMLLRLKSRNTWFV